MFITHWMCWAVIASWFCLVYLQEFYFIFLILLLLNVVCLLLFVVWPELLKCYSDIIIVNSSKCEYDVMISPLIILFLSCVCMCLWQFIGLNSPMISLLFCRHFTSFSSGLKKKSDRFTCLLLSAVSYCRQIYIETAPYIYRNWFPLTVRLVLSTPLPSAAYAS